MSKLQLYYIFEIWDKMSANMWTFRNYFILFLLHNSQSF